MKDFVALSFALAFILFLFALLFWNFPTNGIDGKNITIYPFRGAAVPFGLMAAFFLIVSLGESAYHSYPYDDNPKISFPEPCEKREALNMKRQTTERKFNYYWKCDYCTLLNDWEDKLCHHCGSPRNKTTLRLTKSEVIE